jgi:hypothetical protein
MTQEQEILLQEAEKKTYLLARGYNKESDGITFYKVFSTEERHLMFLKKKKIINFVGVIFYRDGMSMKSLGEGNHINSTYKVYYEEDGWWSKEEFEGIIHTLESFGRE